MNQQRNHPSGDKKIKVLGAAAILLALMLVGLILSVVLANSRQSRHRGAASAEVLANSPTAALVTATGAPMEETATAVPVESAATDTPVELAATATSLPPLDPAKWEDWPIVPDRISPKMIEVYRAGQEAGNQADAFSKVGDSNSMMPSFLSCFDFGENGYTIGDYSALEETISQFQGSFSRNSRATANGITAMGLDTYHWYEDDVCWPYESATSCEYRLWKPSIAFIALGTNDVYLPIADFEKHMRSLVQKSLDRFVVPILVTKADDLEKDGSFNRVIAQIAADYEVPLWNLWRAMQPLPNHGLREGDVHPSFNEQHLCDFSGTDLQKFGWTVRNLTALQALDSVWRLLNK